MRSPQLQSVVRASRKFHSRWFEPGHDLAHVERVAALARTIAVGERAAVYPCVAAAYLHNFDRYFEGKRGDPQASGLALARRMLHAASISASETATITEAIRTHSFSKGIAPTNAIGRVLSDADKIDAIGATGTIRCIEVGARRMRQPYCPEDPFCRSRAPDDTRFTLDHFYRKLLVLPERLCTVTGQRIARRRVAWMKSFLAEFRAELGGVR